MLPFYKWHTPRQNLTWLLCSQLFQVVRVSNAFSHMLYQRGLSLHALVSYISKGEADLQRWQPHFVSSPLLSVHPTLGFFLCRDYLSSLIYFFFFLKHWCGLKLNWNSDLLKGSVCIWHVEKEISHPAPMFVFPPSIFVVVKRGEQNGLCIFVGPKTRCKEIKKIGNQWMPFEVFCV